MQGINKIPPGPKRTTLFSLIDVSIKLDRDEERQYQELIHSDYQEVKMLQSIEEVGFEKGIDQGFQLGKHQSSEVIAKNLLQSGKLSNEEIVIVTGMSLKKISELAIGLKSD
jgi:hypothetical protein